MVLLHEQGQFGQNQFSQFSELARFIYGRTSPAGQFWQIVSALSHTIMLHFQEILKWSLCFFIWPVVKNNFFISSSFNSDQIWGVGQSFGVKILWIALLKHVKFSSLFWSVLIIIWETSFAWKTLGRVVILQFLQVTNSSLLLTGWILLHAMHDVDLLMSMAIHCPTSNLSFIFGVAMWIVMSSIGSTVVNSVWQQFAMWSPGQLFKQTSASSKRRSPAYNCMEQQSFLT